MNMGYTEKTPWNKEEIHTYLKQNLKERRYRHVLGVVKAAERLAAIYGEDVEKAQRAALFHDILKDKDKDWLLSYMKDHKEEPGEGLLAWKTLHAPAGALFIAHECGETDPDILNAVRYHTTGRAQMSLLEKILFVADYIEEGRSFPGVTHLRQLAEKDLNQAVLSSLEGSIAHLKARKEPVASQSITAIAYYRQLIAGKDHL